MDEVLKEKKIGLFIPCYINAVYPDVGIACYKLLCSLGLDVDYPIDQTCCGQPMANGGYQSKSKHLAERFDKLFKEYDYIVGPSASCVAFVKEFHPQILGRPVHECHSSEHIYDLSLIHIYCSVGTLKVITPLRPIGFSSPITLASVEIGAFQGSVSKYR